MREVKSSMSVILCIAFGLLIIICSAGCEHISFHAWWYDGPHEGVAVVSSSEPGPPPHAPAYGRRARAVSYYYYPDVEVYYCIESGNYYWLEGGDWRVSIGLPSHIVIGNKHRVKMELDYDKPYIRHHEIKRKHPPRAPYKVKVKAKEAPPKSKAKVEVKGKAKAKGKLKVKPRP